MSGLDGATVIVVAWLLFLAGGFLGYARGVAASRERWKAMACGVLQRHASRTWPERAP